MLGNTTSSRYVCSKDCLTFGAQSAPSLRDYGRRSSNQQQSVGCIPHSRAQEKQRSGSGGRSKRQIQRPPRPLAVSRFHGEGGP